MKSTGGGICVQPDDEETFIDACAGVLGGSEPRTRMAEAAAQAAGRFDAAEMIQRYEQVFEAAVESAPLPFASVAA